MAQMQGMILYSEYMESFELLPAEDFKNLMVNAMRYSLGKDIGELTPYATLFWPMLSAKIDSTRERYEKKCRTSRENAEKRWRREKQAQDNGTARGDVLFSEPDAEQMNCTDADAVQAKQPEEKEARTDIQSTACDALPMQKQLRSHPTACQPIQTETVTETVTKTKTETETETVTVAEAKTETETKAGTHLPAPDAAVRRSAGQADNGIGCGSDCDCGIGIEHAGSTVHGYDGNDNGSDCGGDIRKPTKKEVRNYCSQYAILVDAERFYQYYEERGWQANGEPIQSWRAMVDHWQKLGEQQRAAKQDASDPSPETAGQDGRASYDIDAFLKASMEKALSDDWDFA